MKLKLRLVSKVEVIEVPDDSTIEDLLKQISQQHSDYSPSNLDIRVGFPPKSLNLANKTVTLQSLNIRNNEQLWVYRNSLTPISSPTPKLQRISSPTGVSRPKSPYENGPYSFYTVNSAAFQSLRMDGALFAASCPNLADMSPTPTRPEISSQLQGSGSTLNLTPKRSRAPRTSVVLSPASSTTSSPPQRPLARKSLSTNSTPLAKKISVSPYETSPVPRTPDRANFRSISDIVTTPPSKQPVVSISPGSSTVVRSPIPKTHVYNQSYLKYQSTTNLPELVRAPGTSSVRPSSTVVTSPIPRSSLRVHQSTSALPELVKPHGTTKVNSFNSKRPPVVRNIQEEIRPPTPPLSPGNHTIYESRKSHSHSSSHSRSHSHSQFRNQSYSELLESKTNSSSKSKSTPSIPKGVNILKTPMVATEKNGYLHLRVQKNDNQCMFRAVGFCILGDPDKMMELREIVADTITKDYINYNDAILGQKREEYIQWILKSTSWGGAIELHILSKHFKITINSFDVSTGRIDQFNPGQEKFCNIIYSGIHYDTIALSTLGNPNNYELDKSLFNIKDSKISKNVVMNATSELVSQLKCNHFYTNIIGYKTGCDLCAEKFRTSSEVSRHIRLTGHTKFKDY